MGAATEPGIGEAIERSGIDRSALYIVTKIKETDDAYQATKRGLDELRLDYADLMLIHRPPPIGAGEKLWEDLIRATQDRLARDIGVSNYSAELIDTLVDATGEVPAVNQIESNVARSAIAMKCGATLYSGRSSSRPIVL